MSVKVYGAVLILLGSGAFGYSLVRGVQREKAMLRMLSHTLKWMECELRYHITPLPDLCAEAAEQTGNWLRHILKDLSRALERQTAPDADGCMGIVLQSYEEIPVRIRRLLSLLGSSLGRFDLSGQLEGLQEVQATCALELEAIRSGREQRMKNYVTISLCAGAAVVILLM